MRYQSFRKAGAHLLFVALLTTGLAFAPSTAFGQSTKQAKKLSKKEDPSMIGQRNINGGWDKITGWFGGSKQKEIEIGRQLSLQVEQQAKMVEDPKITEYINRVGQNIVLNSDAKIPFTIKVIDSDEVNAFALPGGYFFVNKGLIVAAENEAELAGVMAHEVAHVAARHAMENAGKGALLNYGLIAGIIFTGGITGAILQNTAGLGQALAFFKFSRGAEKEADMLGVQYLYASGYDPTGMATMFEKLASKNKKKPGTLSKLFSSHPQSIDRRDASIALVARFPEKEEYIISTSEFQRIREHLLRISNSVSISPDDIDEGGSGRPTLKRRNPVPDSSDDEVKPSTTKDKGPPKLKRRNPPTDSDNDN
ncbi:MAG: M48 family metalloprotease [Pyrinomonadaceae bacterium]|nr:M48 family metalloprotease [Pyrinomonadaceae bacterium]